MTDRQTYKERKTKKNSLINGFCLTDRNRKNNHRKRINKLTLFVCIQTDTRNIKTKVFGEASTHTRTNIHVCMHHVRTHARMQTEDINTYIYAEWTYWWTKGQAVGARQIDRTDSRSSPDRQMPKIRMIVLLRPLLLWEIGTNFSNHRSWWMIVVSAFIQLTILILITKDIIFSGNTEKNFETQKYRLQARTHARTYMCIHT